MLVKLREWLLKPPKKATQSTNAQLPDVTGEKAHRARILVTTGLVFTAVGIILFATRLVQSTLPTFPPQPWTDLFLDMVIAGVGAAALWLVRTERIQTASWSVLSAILIIAGMQIYMEGSLATSVAGALALVVFISMAMVLLERRDQWLAFLAAAMTFVGMQTLEFTGHLPPHPSRDPRSMMVFSAVVWLAASGIIVAVIRSTITVMRKQAASLWRNLCDLRQAEQALREQSVTLTALLNAPLETVALMAPDGQLLSINESGARRLGSSPQDLVGRNLYTILPPDLAGTRKAFMDRVFQSGTPVQFEDSRAGMQISSNVYPIFDENNELVKSVAIFASDITDQRQAQEALRWERDRALALEEAAATVNSTLDLDQVLDRILDQVSRVVPNDAVCIMLVEGDEARAVRWRGYDRFGSQEEISDAVMRVSEVPNVQRMIETGKPSVVSDTILDPEWGTRPTMGWLRSSASAPVILRGEVIGILNVDSATPGFYVRGHADTLRAFANHAATAIDNANLFRETAQLKAFHENIVQNMDEGILVEDENGVITFCNPAAASMLACSSESLVGKHWLDLVPPDQHTIVRAARQRRVREQVNRYELEMQQMDGTRLPVLISRVPWSNPDTHRLAGRLAVFADVSEQKNLEKQFHQAQKMEALGRLAGGVAHDFNNLLTVIHLSTRILENKLYKDDPLWEHVKRIQESAQRGTGLIQQLLSFNRQEVMRPQDLDLNEIVVEMSKMLKRVIGEDVDMVTRLAEDLGSTRMDPTQADQILMNLAVNARDAMPEGGTLTIETANVMVDDAPSFRHLELDPGDYVMLIIRDTGVGMPPEVKMRIFEPFFTTKEMGKGTGLGLATVFGIVKQNGGDIWVDSEPGRGTTFKIYLPRGTVTAARIPPSKTEPTTVRGTETILVVEDEADVRYLTVSILSAQGFRVLQAADGAQALQVAAESEAPIDLVLTDMIMPRLNGHDLIIELATKYPNMRALLMSGYSDRPLAIGSGANSPIAFLPKPFTVERLTQKIREVLDGDLGSPPSSELL